MEDRWWRSGQAVGVGEVVEEAVVVLLWWLQVPAERVGGAMKPLGKGHDKSFPLA